MEACFLSETKHYHYFKSFFPPVWTLGGGGRKVQSQGHRLWESGKWQKQNSFIIGNGQTFIPPSEHPIVPSCSGDVVSSIHWHCPVKPPDIICSQDSRLISSYLCQEIAIAHESVTWAARLCLVPPPKSLLHYMIFFKQSVNMLRNKVKFWIATVFC